MAMIVMKMFRPRLATALFVPPEKKSKGGWGDSHDPPEPRVSWVNFPPVGCRVGLREWVGWV
jgi:hypothetical protein